MFPEMKLRETWRLQVKTKLTFTEGADIKYFVLHPEDDQSKQTNKLQIYFFQTLQLYDKYIVKYI